MAVRSDHGHLRASGRNAKCAQSGGYCLVSESIPESIEGNRRPLRLSGAVRKTFKRLPPTLIICAEVGPLIDENRAHAEKLEQTGIRVELEVFPGMFHGLWQPGGVLVDAKNAIQDAAGWLASAMAT